MNQTDLSPSVLQQLQEIAFCGEYHKAFDADCGYCADHLKVADRAYRLALSSSQECHAENKRFVLATLNAIGEISVQEAMTAIEKEWPK